MDRERHAQIVKQPPKHQDQGAHARRLAIGQRTIKHFVERLDEAGARPINGPARAELLTASGELFEGSWELDIAHARDYFAQAVQSDPSFANARLGWRRVSRAEQDTRAVLQDLEEAIEHADPAEARRLRFELARSVLYQSDRPRRALMILEDLERERDKKGWMGLDVFLLWEDVLWTLGDWRRYEVMLRDALAQVTRAGLRDCVHMLEERLFYLYQYVLPDARQASIITDHLMTHAGLEPERLEMTLRQLAADEQHDDIMALLHQALQSEACASREMMYRMQLADLARYHCEDLDHAARVLQDGLGGDVIDPLIVYELLDLQQARGDVSGLVDALGFSLEVLTEPSARADVLYRIGHLLLEVMRVPDAAEEVLVEALREWPTHRPALRTLGRILHARQDWPRLAELYENELAARDDEGRWRQHAKLAELYEDRLANVEQAFIHYRHALTLKPAYLPSLKGASRMAARLKRWVELLECYAAAEAATTDPKQRVYLLERIAHIADDHLDDHVTARKALEAVRLIEPRHPAALTALARLYAKHDLFDDLVALNDEELSWTEDPESAAALLCRNGDLCAHHLNDDARSETYYREALALSATFLPALEGLGRLLQRQQRWDDLVTMELAEADAWQDRPEAIACLHRVAELLQGPLERPDDALEIFWRCLRHDPTDQVSREALIQHHQGKGEWEKVCEILELEAEHGGRGGHVAASLLRLGKIKEHHLDDAQGAVDAYRRAFLSDPSSPTLLRTWLTLARKLDALEEPRKTLASVSGEPAHPIARVDLLTALTEFSLRDTQDPLTAAGYLEVIATLEPSRPISTTLFAMAMARASRWRERASVALTETRPQAEQQHGLNASLMLGVPDDLADDSGRVLAHLQGDLPTQLRLWNLCPPHRRPSPQTLPTELRRALTDEAQHLRRWSTLQALRAGFCTEPSGALLPPEKVPGARLRADLELLAAFYEETRQWELTLQILTAQEESAGDDVERVRLHLERSEILKKLERPRQARDTLRDAFKICSWHDPTRDALYDLVEDEGDWEFLIHEIRRQLMHVEDPMLQSRLWRRLSNAIEKGPGDLEEALRALDAAYRSYPSDGNLLSDIARLAEDLGEIPIAQRALDDYLVYHQPPIDVQLDLAPRLVRLHLEQNTYGGDPDRVITWLEDLAVRSCDEPRALRALAEAHSRVGNAYHACDVLLRLVKLPYKEEDLELWLMLAQLYGGPLQDPLKAEALFWELQDHFPENDVIWEAIDAFYAGADGRVRLVSQLEHVLDRAPQIGWTTEQQRRFMARLGAILGDELGRWRDSQDVYLRAIEVSAQPAPDLAKQRAFAMIHVPGGLRDAYRGFCELLIEDPFQPELLGKAIGLCDNAQAFDRARILRQVARFFTPDAGLHKTDDNLRPKLDPTRDLTSEVLARYLLLPPLRGALYDVLHEALPLIELVHRDDLPKLSDVGGKRIRSKDELNDVFSFAASLLGLGSVKILVGEDGSPVPMVFSSPNAFWIPKEQWEQIDDAARRHWAGYAAGLLWTNLAPLVYLEGRDIWQLLDGIYYSQTQKGLSPNGRTAYTIEAAEKVKSPWHRRARKEISRLLEVAGPRVHGEKADLWIEWLHATGDRCGLLFSGDVGTSMRALLVGEGWRGEHTEATLRRQLNRSPRMHHLIQFALSEDYLALRHAAGLAPRPSNLD